MAREDAQLKFRVTADLRSRIEEAAAKNGRSLNAEIVLMLESYETILNAQDDLERNIHDLHAKIKRLTEQRNDAHEAEHAIGRQLLEAKARLADFESSLTPNLRGRLEEEAKANKRTLAGEIAYRLEGSFSKSEPEPAQPSHENTLYVLVDVEGVPTSWTEIQAHLSQILRAGGVEYDRVDVKVLAPDFRSSRERDDQWIELIDQYRAKRTLDRIGKGLAASKKRNRAMDLGKDDPSSD